MRAEIILAAFVVACSASTTPQVICPDTTPIYTEDEAGAASSPCGRACANLVALGCPEGNPSASGASCYVVCRKAGPALDADCVANAKTKAALAKCNVRCTP